MCGYSKRELVGFKARDVLLDQEQRQYMEKKVSSEIILNVNNAFAKMSGYSRKELVGFKARDILLDKDKKQYMQQKVKSRQKGN